MKQIKLPKEPKKPKSPIPPVKLIVVENPKYKEKYIKFINQKTVYDKKMKDYEIAHKNCVTNIIKSKNKKNKIRLMRERKQRIDADNAPHHGAATREAATQVWGRR